MALPTAIIFDLDETLAPSFQAPSSEMIDDLQRLLDRTKIAIMSGAGFDRIKRDVLDHMQNVTENFYIFPNSSSQCFMYENRTWLQKYDNILTPEERVFIKKVLEKALQQYPSLQDAPALGQQIVDREAQIAFTPVGLDAAQNIKTDWDPTAQKRVAAARLLKDELPDFDILIGGAATIDITRKDVNKAYGVRWFANYLNIQPEQMLYIGDALYPGGNDEVVIQTGVQTRSVSGPADTLSIVRALLVQNL